MLTNGLVNQISSRIPSLDPQTIIAAGATGLRTIVSSDLLGEVLQAYNSAVRNVFIISIVTGSLCFITSFGFEWKNIKGINLAAGIA